MIHNRERWQMEILAEDDGIPGGGEAPQEPPAGEALAEDDFQTVYIEGVDEIPQEEPPVDPDAVRRENEELQRQIDQLKAEADLGRNLNQSISQLGESLQQPRRTEPRREEPQQKPGESEEEFAKRLRDSFYDDPYQMLNEFQYRKLQPLVAQMVNNNLANSRRFLQVDPGKKGGWQKYQGEIEDEVQGMGYQEKMSDPDIYSKAYDRVMARHMDDILEEKIQERLAEMEKGRSSREEGPPQTTSSEQTQYRPAGGRKTVKKLTREEADDAFRKGVPKDQYYDWLVRTGRKA